jgi:hypothetical protein
MQYSEEAVSDQLSAFSLPSPRTRETLRAIRSCYFTYCSKEAFSSQLYTISHAQPKMS